jgi:adenine-specific DNA-methyltransferase
MICGKEKHDEVIKLVDHVVLLNEELHTAKLSTQIDSIRSKISYYENRINELVYGLYGLTEEEIRIVEGKGREGMKIMDEGR